ncbi:Transcriptional regulator, MarR family [Moritella sp. JT01]|uniref:MarR family winged helix-turn-helix transcriptional regulator n=1 Tax=Moritella sp. JT01 TaxID=756698 RepID=UPI000795E18A|nr:MarR family transcriptional regulator [Moritella sp. JT01]KXO13845.1 Transcriptional regulator, MarR family [Moritella sp. JT01]
MAKSITNIPTLDNSISFMMGLAYKQFRTLANQVLVTEFDITLEMLGTLRALEQLGELPQQKLAEALLRERSVIKRLVDNCIKRKLIAAHKSDTNKKARYLSITAKGIAVKDAAHKRIQQVTTDYYSPLTAEEQQQLLTLNKKIIQVDMIVGND